MRRTAIAVVAVVIVVVAIAAVFAQNTKPVESNAEVVRQLRNTMLAAVPEGTSVGADEPVLVIMDIVHPDGIVSVMSSTTGDASLYFSNGGAMVGGIGRENIRSAAKAFIREVASHRDQFTAVTDYAYPAGSNVRFFLRTRKAVYMAETPQGSLVNGQSPLATAFLRGQDVITQFQKISGNKAESKAESNAALIQALAAHDSAKLKEALTAGADPNSVDARGTPALIIAVSAKNAPFVQLLLDAGADPNTRFTDASGKLRRAPAVQFAGANGSVETLLLLAKAGADLNAADATGLTPLMAAAYMGHPDVVDALVKAGAGLEKQDESGYTALMFANNSGNADVVRQLLTAGANANARALDDSTPLMFAAQVGCDDCVRLLCAAGADSKAVGKHGLSAIGFARQNRHTSTERLLAACR